MAASPFTTIATLPAAAASAYTNPASTVTQIGSISLHNTNTTAEIVELNFIPNASGALGAAATTNRIVRVTLAADDTVEITQKFPWTLASANDSIFGKSTTAAKVTIAISGLKTT